jgi:hypothetical protein
MSTETPVPRITRYEDEAEAALCPDCRPLETLHHCSHLQRAERYMREGRV